MNAPTLNKDALDIDAALAGLDVVEDDDGLIVRGAADVLIERLLDQISLRGREAFEGEDRFLRRAIACYEGGSIHGAVSSLESRAGHASS